MAKIVFTVETSSGTVNFSGPIISDAKMIRFTDWCWYAFPQLNPDGSPKPKTNATVANAVKDWARGLWKGTVANVRRHESDKAEQAARDGVSDIG